MARKSKNKQADNLADHAGPDADQEAIAKLAEAARKANAKGGHNSAEPPDEVVQRNANAIEVALIELDEALKIVQGARASLGAARKTAKTDLGSKGWVDSIVAAVKLKREAARGGTGEIVTEHRQMGRVLRLIDCPLGTQFKLFAFPDDEVAAGPSSAMDAELQGQHAYRNNEPRENNPFQPGTGEHVDWGLGWNAAQTATAMQMKPGNGEAPAH